MTEPAYATGRQARPKRHDRLRSAVLVCVAAAAIGAGTPASAQMDDYGNGYVPRGYGYYDGGPYGYGPRPPAAIPPRTIGRTAQRDFGLADIERMVRTDASYVVDGRTASGARERLIFDRYSGRMVDRIILDRQVDRRTGRVARLDPQERPAARPELIPHPPIRPQELRPSEASAPATMPAPAEPRRAVEPAAPAAPVQEPPPQREAQAPEAAPAPPPRSQPSVPAPDAPAVQLAPVVPLY